MMWTNVREYCVGSDSLQDVAGIVMFCLCHKALSSDTPAKSFDLRSPLFLIVRSGVLRGYQMLHRNWVVIKVTFGCVVKHGWDMSGSRWNLPLSHNKRDFLWAPQGDWIRKCMAVLCD